MVQAGQSTLRSVITQTIGIGPFLFHLLVVFPVRKAIMIFRQTLPSARGSVATFTWTSFIYTIVWKIARLHSNLLG
jgi:hypothetical protein